MDLRLTELLAPKGFLRDYISWNWCSRDFPDMVQKVVDEQVQVVRTVREVDSFLIRVQRHNAGKTSAHNAAALVPWVQYFRDESGLSVDTDGLQNAVDRILANMDGSFVGLLTLDTSDSLRQLSYLSVTSLEEVFWVIQF